MIFIIPFRPIPPYLTKTEARAWFRKNRISLVLVSFCSAATVGILQIFVLPTLARFVQATGGSSGAFSKASPLISSIFVCVIMSWALAAYFSGTAQKRFEEKLRLYGDEEKIPSKGLYDLKHSCFMMILTGGYVVLL